MQEPAHPAGPRRRSGPAAGAGLLAAVLLAATSSLIFAPAAAAGSAAVPASLTFRVTSTADTHDAHPGDGHCADAAGRCTLRAAIEEADASPAGTKITISVPAGRYHLTLGSLSLGSATSPPLSITIDGAGPGRTIIDGGNAFRVMSVAASATVILDQLQISGGNAGPNGYGGGVLSTGTLTVAASLIDGNRAGAGGGLDNAGGSLVVTGSRIEDNNGGFFGGGGIQNGGPQNLPGSVLVVSSTISGNFTQNEGGGIFSGQNGHPSVAGQAAVRPRRLCPPIRCPGQRAPTAAQLTLTILDSNVSGNRGANGGGGISAQGPASVIRSVIDNNSARAAIGGGVFNVTSIRGSTISGNSAFTGGGVEDYPSLRMTITSSTLDRNHVSSYGGAIEVNGEVIVTRSTIAGNTAGGQFLGAGSAVVLDGGAILQMSNSTVASNFTKPAGGGAIYNYGGLATLSFDTFSGNSGTITGSSYTTATGTIFATNGSQPNCATPLHETAGYNLSTDSSCGLSLSTDLTGASPKLGALARNGGPTSTMALLPGSPAIDSGGLPSTSGCPLTDQRGASRPWGPACDVGAFELHYHR